MNFVTKVCIYLGLAFFSMGVSADTILINGAGASFPYPIYSKWFAEYKKVKPNVEINYQMIGSGAGIRQLLAQTVDFGASDAPMGKREMKRSRQPVLHIPTVIGAVVVSYNIPGLQKNLRLDGNLLAEIFMGKVSRWNDPKIAALNSNVTLPDTEIVVVHRSDSSGTTYVFTDYLSKVNPDWKKTVGHAKTVRWPKGLGGRGNPGVAGQIKNTPGAIGYIEFNYAQQNDLKTADLKNQAGEFVSPSKGATTKAAMNFMDKMPEDFRISITNPPGKGAYPISAFTYILAYNSMVGSKAQVLSDFIGWAMGPGQAMAGDLSYAPLPDALIKKVKASVKINSTK